MFHVVHTFALVGVEPDRVRVEITIRRGTPGIRTTGLAGAAARESIERIRAVIAGLGLRIPGLRITANLAPADLPKTGAAFDLPLCIGILAAAGEVPDARLHRIAFTGEIGLDGTIRPVRGALPMALRCRSDPDLDALVLPHGNLGEVSEVPGVRCLGARDVTAILAFLSGRGRLEPAGRTRPPPDAPAGPALSEVRGQSAAKRALEIAAAGGHHLLLSGEPGAGKTMLAMRLPGLLPGLELEEALEVASLHSVAGCLVPGARLSRQRPVRAPHHSVSIGGLIGGGSLPRPGEASLAHRGVLFLDELAEFRATALDALRAPLEQGVVTIARARGTVSFPARFQLLAAMNPCPCGYRTSSTGRCTCDEWLVRRYQARVSGPLLDRFDLRLEVPAVSWSDLRPESDQPGDAQRRRERIARARALCRERSRTGHRPAPGWERPSCNAELEPRELRRQCGIDAAGRRVLGSSVRRLGLSARGCDRVLAVARTIADLEGSHRVRADHVAEAIHFRRPMRGS